MSIPLDVIGNLSSAEESDRMEAAHEIGYLNLAEGVGILLEHLKEEKSRLVRSAMVHNLIRIEHEEAIRAAVSLLGSEDAQIRNQAVEVLRHKGSQSIPHLLESMQTGNSSLRKMILDAMSQISSTGACPIYEIALGDADPNVVITALENVGVSRCVGFQQEIEALLSRTVHPMMAGACLEALSAVGDANSLRVIRERFPVMADLPDFILVAYLKAIGSLGGSDDVEPVGELLSSRRPSLHVAILNSLVALLHRLSVRPEGSSLVVKLEEVLSGGGEPMARYLAVRAMGFLAIGESGLRLLHHCLADPEKLVRLGAIESLRELGAQDLPHLFESLLATESDPEVLQAMAGEQISHD